MADDIYKDAEQGNAEAQFRLGMHYLNKDGLKALGWFQKAASQGHSDAQFHLGLLYEEGVFSREDEEGAITIGLGFLERDHEKSFSWYQKSSKQGHAEAQFRLGMMYKNGCGVAQDDWEALNWFQKAAFQGHSDAQFRLGLLYEKGLHYREGVITIGMDQNHNYEESFSWYQKSSEQDHAEAQFRLSIMYKNGRGVAQDDRQALYWFEKSSKHGCRDVMKGIAFPVGFKYEYRGHRYSEIEFYFSFEAIKLEDIDLLEPGRNFKKEIKHLLNHGVQGDFDYLIPLEVKKLEKYDAPWDVKFSVGTINNNPTISTFFNAIELFPCKSNNFKTMLKLLNYPPFYFLYEDNKFWLELKVDNERYLRIPSQNYCPRCYEGFAHPTIQIVTDKGGKGVYNYSDIDWNKIQHELTMMSLSHSEISS